MGLRIKIDKSIGGPPPNALYTPSFDFKYILND